MRPQKKTAKLRYYAVRSNRDGGLGLRQFIVDDDVALVEGPFATPGEAWAVVDSLNVPGMPRLYCMARMSDEIITVYLREGTASRKRRAAKPLARTEAKPAARGKHPEQTSSQPFMNLVERGTAALRSGK